MKSTSLYVFIALGALLISHTSAAPIADLAKLGKEFIKFLVSSNKQAEAETSDSQTFGDQVDALIQVAYDGMNEVLAAAQQYADNQYQYGARGGRYYHGDSGRFDTFEDSFRE
jgi:hypothetical protein